MVDKDDDFKLVIKRISKVAFIAIICVMIFDACIYAVSVKMGYEVALSLTEYIKNMLITFILGVATLLGLYELAISGLLTTICNFVIGTNKKE